jgi:hypothetical protein
VLNVKNNIYTTHIGSPKIRGFDCLQPQKSSESRNKTINNRNHTALFLFGNQKGNFFIFIPPN